MAVSHPVAVSWALSQTAGDVIGISKGVLAAATTDDVQPIALLACEAFESTVPMSEEVKAKMHQVCSQDHQSAVLKFLKVQIGYKKGDSGWHLARSDSGLRFLGLAACLLSTDLWASSELLRDVIRDTAQDKVLIPTSQQLKALLLKLQHRLERTGFVNDILGWNILLNKRLTQQCNDPKPPSREVIEKLLKCSASLLRIGDARHKLLRLKIQQNQAAWAIAFLKWCFGAPPMVKLQDGVVIVAQTSTQTEIILVANAKRNDVEVSLCDELNTISELFKSLKDGNEYTQGLVSVQKYAEKLRQELGPEESLYCVNAMQLVPYACHAVCQNLVHERGYELERSVVSDLHGQSIKILHGSILPDEQTLVDTMRRFKLVDNIYSVKEIPRDFSISTLPPAIAVQQLFRQSCRCRDCDPNSGHSGGSGHSYSVCDFEQWLSTISSYVGMIFLLSMVIPMDPTGILLCYRSAYLDVPTRFAGAIHQCLMVQSPTYCSADYMLNALLYLLGHVELPKKLGSHDAVGWIASSKLGQTVYPEILQSFEVRPRGLLRLICLPGVLSRSDTSYERIVEEAAWDQIEDHMTGNYDKEEGSLQMLSPPIIPRDNYSSANYRGEYMKGRIVFG